MSTRKVDQLVQALGMTGISKSTVSVLCQGLDDDQGKQSAQRAGS